MDNGLIFMIIGTALLVCAAIALGIYGWKLSKKFPNTVKAKVLRIETTIDGKNRYHFECKNNGRYIAEDIVAYKDKKWKVGEKTTVRLNTKGDTCHSNFPIWPVATSIVCIVLAAMLPLVYFTEKRNDERAKEAEGSLYQETGYYIVTNETTFMYGDNLGLIALKNSENHISTGDYGSVFFLGTPKYEGGSIIPTIQSLGSNVTTDGAPSDVPSDAIKRIENMDLVINRDITDSKTILEEEGVLDEESHDHDGDGIDDHTGEAVEEHDHDEEITDDVTSGESETKPESENGPTDFANDEETTESVKSTESATTNPTE